MNDPQLRSSPLAQLMRENDGELNTGDPAVLQAAAQAAHELTQSQHFKMDLWNHGGAYQGMCWDDTNRDELTLAEMREALSGLDFDVDVLGFDACLMQTMSVAASAALSEAGVQYMVASEETEPFDGWEYDAVFEQIVQSYHEGDDSLTPEAMAQSIVRAYHAETLSAICTKDWAPVVGALNGLGDVLLRAGGIENARIASILNPREGKLPRPYDLKDLVDGISFCRALESELAGSTKEAERAVHDAAEALRQRLEARVVGNNTQHEPGVSNGITLFLPPRAGYREVINYQHQAADLLQQCPACQEFILSMAPRSDRPDPRPGPGDSPYQV